MKKIITLFVLFTTTLFYSQSSGITYQAVLHNPSGEILPGNNNTNVVLSNKDICLRFSITDAQTSLEYQETQRVTTDEFGMVNLVIGSGNQIGGYAASFAAILWNSTTKKLQVAIDVTGTCSNFVEISNQNFSAVPFAYASKTAESVSGIVPIVNGGTGSSTVSGAKTNLGLNNVDNTSDANKPISTAAQTALDTKESVSNKSSNPLLGNSEVFFPTQNAVKTYVDNQISSGVVDANSSIKGKIKLAGDLGGTADLPTVPGLANKENTIVTGTISQYWRGDKTWQTLDKSSVGLTNVDNTSDANKPVSTAVQTALDTKVDKVFGKGLSTEDYTTAEKTKLSGIEAGAQVNVNADWNAATGDGLILNKPTIPSITGLASEIYVNNGLVLKEDTANKSDVTSLGTSDVLFPTQNAVKVYVDTQISANATPDATTTLKGKLQLTGDLGGTADAPTVPGLALKAPLESPSLTGTPLAPTAAAGTNTTQIATTAFVTTATAGKQDAITLTTSGTGAASLEGSTLNIPTPNNGTVTEVSALTIGTLGTDITSTVATATTTPVITLNVPTASAANRGALSATDWTTFNDKIGGSGTTNFIPKFSAAKTLTYSSIFDDGTKVGIGTSSPSNTLEINQGTAGNSGLRFTNLNSSSAATTTSSKVLGLDSNGDVVLTNVPGTQNVVSFSTATPTTSGVVFIPNTPSDPSVIYQSTTNNSLWTYDGTNYVTYTAPASTAWNLTGTNNDAGNSKTSSIWRTGGIILGDGVTSSNTFNGYFLARGNMITNPTIFAFENTQTAGTGIFAGNGGGSNFLPNFRMSSSSTFRSIMIGEIQTDSGSDPALQFRSQLQGLGPIVNRPTFTWVNGGVGGTEQMRLTANGRLGINNTAPLGRLIVDDKSYISNLPASSANLLDNTTFRPHTRFQNTVGANNNALSLYSTTAAWGIQSHNYSDGTALPFVLQPTTGFVGVNITNPVSTLANTSTIITGSNTTSAINGGFTWVSSGSGFAGGIYNANPDGNGFLIKNNATGVTNNVLEVATGTQSTTINSLLNVKGNGNVGIGTNSPISKFEVNGSATNTAAYNNGGSATAIAFSMSNLAYTTLSPQLFALTGIKDGGTYTLAVQGPTQGTSTFMAPGFTFRYVNNGPSIANTHTLYTFIVMGTTVYVYTTIGFTP